MPKILDSMDLQSKKANFKRDSFKTLSDMINYPEYSMPENHRVTCDETPGIVYLFNSNFEVDPNLGKYRKIIDVNNPIINNNSDGKIKLQSTSVDTKYLEEIIDNKTITIDVDNQLLIAKKIDGQEITITELNYLKGLDENLMDKLASFLSGGTKTYPNTFLTYADLEAFDFTTLNDGKTYLMYIAEDETKDNNPTVYLCDKTTNNTDKKPNYAGLAQAKQRDFTTSPIDLEKEVTNKLLKANLPNDIVYNDNLTDYMQEKDFVGDTATKAVLKADTITGYTKQKVKNTFDNEHSHNNQKDILDKLGKDENNNLTFNNIKVDTRLEFKEWNPLTNYEQNNYAVNNNKLYICLENHVSENDFNIDLENGKWKLFIGSDEETNFEDWQPDKLYEIDKLVVYQKVLYKCITEHISNSFKNDKDNWKIYIGGDNNSGSSNIERSDINGNIVVDGEEVKVYDDTNVMKKEDYDSEINKGNVKSADVADKIALLENNSEPNVYYGHNSEGITGLYPFPIGTQDESKLITKEYLNVTEGWEKIITESLIPLNDKVMISVLKTVSNPTDIDVTIKDFNLENEITINHSDKVSIKDNQISIQNEFVGDNLTNSDGLLETDLSSYTQINRCEVK